MKAFIDEDFLLQTNTAKTLYHDYARHMPIIDYHCHLPPDEIAQNRQFKNLTQVWLHGDHYKWRAMRANGVDEKYITGEADDESKFLQWAATVPYTMRNPLYHWTHLELKNPFGIHKILDKTTASGIYNECNEKLATSDFTVRGILKTMNVTVICTTDDPTDTLEHHRKIKSDGLPTKVLPTFRPDKGMQAENPAAFNEWINKLQGATNIDISTFEDYLKALQNRHNYFHENGCRLSDHGIETIYAEDFTREEIRKIFDKVRSGIVLGAEELLKFKSAMLYHFALMDHARGWTQQFHIGALRNNNTRMMKLLGPDTGFDSIGDFSIARALARFLDKLDATNQLAKTILYNLNPRDNELFATMIGNFNDGSIAGKIQFGSAWWFLDQKDGMEKQMNALSNLGLLSRFVGMLTDSRSFLSYSRHEYFRRIVCNLFGNDVENGEVPHDIPWLGELIKNICFNNANDYFKFDT